MEALKKIADLPGKGSSYVGIVRDISRTALSKIEGEDELQHACDCPDKCQVCIKNDIHCAGCDFCYPQEEKCECEHPDCQECKPQEKCEHTPGWKDKKQGKK